MSSDLLDGLDPDQRQIAEHLRGPVMVLAGAGTGKTRTLTHRIAHGVRVGAYAPERVLAVTFTRKAAGEMQSRLRGLGAVGVRAQTFHGAALAQLGFFWPQLVGGAAPQVVGGKIPVISQAVESLGLRLPGETLRDIAAEIEWRKVSMLDMESYAARLVSARDPRPVPSGISAEQLLDIHEKYAAVLSERRQIDFEDVLVLTTGMLETEPRAAIQVRERYRFFTVDEYQDVSPLQHALLQVWLGDRDELCVVGDASQTIYSFAGASSSYLLRFGAEHPNAREFRLERNYRSSNQIVQVSNKLMKGRPGALTLRAERAEPGAPVSAEWFVNEHDEAQAVAASIRVSIAAGTPASEIAVLYRANAQSAIIESALQQLGVSARVVGAQRFFDRAEVRQAVMLMRGQAKVADPRPLFQVVSDVLRACGWTASPPEGGAARERWDALNAILTLLDEQPPGTTMQSFSEELLARSQAHHEPTVEAVTLSAVHSAKGLEWGLVHLIGMNEGLFPNAYAVDESGIDEERRLAYVAFTRARNELRISGTAGSARSQRMPSRFIEEAGLKFGA
ncbi:ATP-dependent helicase [Leucobacter sp. UT-8R-CII-1-4]|uniref:ATP-dependent helicase n=1 Tax=Leucobacter sp. UT-8R-CII-1-4 TaxID=3040075 RepID=UPI0024A91959|nr:ATP-dependent helicase [Leucobacter sp. UT-8R-CII-1-4]MDI6023111.1 ATP-dependent helicase [Leucobacter sp. UT-8R-CII-1-4]